GMTYPYAVFTSCLAIQDRELVAFSDLARAYVRTLWHDAIGSSDFDASTQAIRQRYRTELARLTGNTASAGKTQADLVEAA
ncbi:MAG: hypothetical protein PHT19_17515, partial [Methylococcus sp.]|nr:hypothetical protein [Methylococcus sp.]